MMFTRNERDDDIIFFYLYEIDIFNLLKRMFKTIMFMGAERNSAERILLGIDRT